MTKRILIISATSGNNLVLAKKLNKICADIKIVSDLINLEEYDIPLYTSIVEQKSIQSQMQLIREKLINASGLIFCAPEYNGSIPPILTNVIAWLSVMENDWRLVFNGKIGLLATHSGGSGNNLMQSLRIQLNHLGMIILPRTIIVNNKLEYDKKSAQEKVKHLTDLL